MENETVQKQFRFSVPEGTDKGFMRYQRSVMKVIKAQAADDGLNAMMLIDEILERYLILDEGQSYDDVVGDMTMEEYSQLFVALTSNSEEEKKDSP